MGTGFSYTSGENYIEVYDLLTTDFMTFMTNLYEMYPEFVGRPLYLCGEGYAAKLIP